MHVEINETNIDKFDLVGLTGNSREFLLSQAADAAAADRVLSCNVPDELVLEQNVFEIYEGEHIDPRRIKGCGYEEREDVAGNKHMLCVMHGKTSRHSVAMDPHAPCLQVDPTSQPSTEAFVEAVKGLTKECVYNKVHDAHGGSTYLCAVHGKPSKFDIARLPNMPCLYIDPQFPGDNDLSRP